ncbi:MAG: 3-hydroxyacyl-ACP dehydratase FabZ [Rhodospirillales bacterium]|nr:3-hydroxyacyl-ACP dehydratase FabZ [Rhodospirillales bacterium]USO07770.1 MAG: 3-hydroxyacyl-ACP dehydratase FabZ [Rhodospirillales bacterium]
MSEVQKNPVIDVHEVMGMIPHRYPILLVDRILDYAANEWAIGLKNVTYNEPHFQGHFPSRAIMPGVLIVEAMAQTAACLVVRTLGEAARGKLVYFMSIEDARFRRPVVPGDALHIHVKVAQSRRNVWKFTGEAKVEGVVCAEATFSAMIMESNGEKAAV